MKVTDAELKLWWNAACEHDGCSHCTRLGRLIAALLWERQSDLRVANKRLVGLDEECTRIGIPYDKVAAVLGLEGL